jgi:hypothetical protein
MEKLRRTPTAAPAAHEQEELKLLREILQEIKELRTSLHPSSQLPSSLTSAASSVAQGADLTSLLPDLLGKAGGELMELVPELLTFLL